MRYHNNPSALAMTEIDIIKWTIGGTTASVYTLIDMVQLSCLDSEAELCNVFSTSPGRNILTTSNSGWDFLAAKHGRMLRRHSTKLCSMLNCLASRKSLQYQRNGWLPVRTTSSDRVSYSDMARSCLHAVVCRTIVTGLVGMQLSGKAKLTFQRAQRRSASSIYFNRMSLHPESYRQPFIIAKSNSSQIQSKSKFIKLMVSTNLLQFMHRIFLNKTPAIVRQIEGQYHAISS